MVKIGGESSRTALPDRRTGHRAAVDQEHLIHAYRRIGHQEIAVVVGAVLGAPAVLYSDGSKRREQTYDESPKAY